MYKQYKAEPPSKLIGIFGFLLTAAVLTFVGGAIGTAIGITFPVANTVFASVFAGFVGALIDGGNIQEALFKALVSVPTGGLAYIGKLGLNAAGVPHDILFVTSGETSGTHKEATVSKATSRIRLAAGFEPLQKLGRRKGVFITYTAQGLRNAGTNRWLKVVTVPAFRPSGCADEPTCKVGGFVLVGEDEVR